jgi:hypothetical protein
MQKVMPRITEQDRSSNGREFFISNLFPIYTRDGAILFPAWSRTRTARSVRAAYQANRDRILKRGKCDHDETPRSYRGRDDFGRPSLRTGLADLPHPALQLVVNSKRDQPTQAQNLQAASTSDARFRGG